MNSLSDPNIDLGIIENLQVLTFIFNFELRFSEILEYLKNPSVTKSLKELTFGVIFNDVIFNEVETITRSNIKEWKDLDAILFSLPTLQKVLTVFTGDLSSRDNSRLPDMIKRRLPRLKRRGILSVVAGKQSPLKYTPICI
jgi:hypothetical protein